MKILNLKSSKTNHRQFAAAVRGLILPALCLAAASTQAATEQWLGVPGVSASLNWTDTANWTPGVQQTYYNQVQFAGSGANANTDFSVNNILDATTGAAQMPIWELDYVPTNGNYTTLINPGVTLTTGAGWGSLYVGADALHNSSPAPADAVETITLTGAGGTLNIGGNIYLGQGSDTPGDAHNVTLDLSGLDNFIDTGGQILVASTGLQNGNGSLYLAKTNQLSLGNNFQIANQSTSNSLPSMVYLGEQNTISIGSGDLTVGGTGSPAGAGLQFNPAFLGGASAPTANFSSSQNGGRIANVVIGNANGGAYTSSSAAVDLSGGNVTVAANSILLGQGGNAGANGFGSLTLDNGSVNANNVTVGNQAVGSGGTGVGVINLNSNSVLGASASLQVNNTLTLAAVTGTLTSGSAGTINVNGGSLTANAIVNGAGAGSINLSDGTLTVVTTAGSADSPISNFSATNSVLNLTLQTGVTNITVAALKTGGATNVINILSAPPIASYPVQIPLIKSSSVAGTFNFGLGTLPPLYAGYLVHNMANSSVDLVLTAGSSTLTWTGASSGDWDFATANWTSGGSPAIYADGDFVQFFDGANNNTVNLTADVSPAGSIIVSNNSTAYTFTGSGGIAGSGSLLKQGAGTLVLDNNGANTFTGDTTIDGGALQIGDNDANGNLPGAVVNNGGLIFARADSSTVNNAISGSGYVEQSVAGSTLTLSGNNSFTGNVIVTNNSVLKLGSGSALGGGGNPIIVADGSTLDINGVYSSRPVIVSGSGTDGSGAIVDNGGAVYGFTSSVTLTGDTTFGYANRWDLDNATLSTGGNAYNLTLAGNGTSSYLEWNNLTIDSALNDITIASVNLGLKGSTSLGDPNGSLILTPSGALTFYNPNVSLSKDVDFQSGSSINVGGGDHVMAGAMTLESGYDSFNINGGTSLTLSNVLSGDGTIYLNGGNGSLILAGNSPAYTGNVLLYNGTVALNGLIGGSITSQSGTTVAGSGTANGAVDIGGDLQPGGADVAGTFHALGGLALEGGATLTCDLSASVSGDNDAVEVGGDLNVNGNNLDINPTGGGLANGTYTLLTYTGNLTGSFGTVATTVNTAYTLTLTNVTTTSPKRIQLIVTGTATPSLLVWNNASGNNQWDVDSSANWTNATTHAAASVFNYLDSVVLDDSIASAATPGTNITIPAGQTVVPTAITENATLNYTIGGDGFIGGTGGLTKLGTGMLSLGVSNNATGPVIIGGGTLQTLANNTLLAASSITVSNGSTFDFAGHAHNSTNPIVIAGSGVNGKGAIYNSTGGIYGELLNIVLAADATIGQFGQGRYDLNSGSQISGAHHLTIDWNGDYGELNSVTIGSTVQGITLTNGNLGMKSMDSAFQNPATVFTASTNCQLTFWNGGFNGSLHLMQGSSVSVYSDPSGWAFNGDSITFEDGVTWLTYGNSGNEPINSAITLNGIAHIQLGDHNLLFTNVISGPGGFLSEYWNHAMIFAASNTYTGPSIINQGGNSLYLALTNDGSISHSALIFFGGSDSDSVRLDASGRVDQTFTLASGQTLAGVGKVVGKLVVSAGATLSPAGTNVTLGITAGSNPTGTISASDDVTLNGVTVIKLNDPGVNDQVKSDTGITYGGTLNVVSSAPLAAGDSFQIFDAASYSGSFAATNLPALDAGLTWDTTQLSSGIIRVVGPGGVGPVVNSPTLADGKLVLSGTGGAANGTYYVLTTTNLASPNWTVISTNAYDASGNFAVTNTLTPGVPQQFYRIQQP